MKRVGVRKRAPKGKEPKPVPKSERRREMREVEVFTFERFDAIGCNANVFLDCATKRVAVRASPYVVSLVSHLGEKRLFICSGTIIRCEENNGQYFGTVLTAATLVRCSSASDVKVEVYLFDGKSFDGCILKYDFCYNIALVRIMSNAPFSVAVTRSVDCRIEEPINMTHDGDFASSSPSSFLCQHNEKPSELGPFNIFTNEILIALGRDYKAPFGVMAAPGRFRFDSRNLAYMELFKTSCRIPKNGIGGPTVNQYGEVIGMNFYELEDNHFIPMNTVFKCLKHDDSRTVPRPWIGVRASNVYHVKLGILRQINLKFGGIVKGIRVDMVVANSPARSSGICGSDVIVKCNGNFVGSSSELVEALWGKEGASVHMVIYRESVAEFLNLTIDSVGTCQEEFSWEVPKEHKVLEWV